MKKELIKIIKKAGKILKAGFYADKDITFKAKKDLVTEYDVAVETYLKKKFSKKFKNLSKKFNFFVFIISPFYKISK